MATEQEVQPSVPAAEEACEENVQQEAEQEYSAAQETIEHPQETKTRSRNDEDRSRSGFIHGLSVGLGLGCIGAFAMTWISLFFTPQMPSSITYETLLSVFIYPLIYMLAVGLIALTAGVVRQYYSMRK